MSSSIAQINESLNKLHSIMWLFNFHAISLDLEHSDFMFEINWKRKW